MPFSLLKLVWSLRRESSRPVNNESHKVRSAMNMQDRPNLPARRHRRRCHYHKVDNSRRHVYPEQRMSLCRRRPHPLLLLSAQRLLQREGRCKEADRVRLCLPLLRLAQRPEGLATEPTAPARPHHQATEVNNLSSASSPSSRHEPAMFPPPQLDHPARVQAVA